MKELIFIDSSRSLNLRNIGGTNSIIRRIIGGLNGAVSVTLIDIRPKSSVEIEPKSLNGEVYCKYNSVFPALALLWKRRDVVVVDIYLHPAQRLIFWLFRIFNRRVSFSKIFFSYPKSSTKRFLSFFDALVWPYNGKVFCVSCRQVQYLRGLRVKNVVRMFPPIPRLYFNQASSVERSSGPITITWVGRLDRGKGADLVFEIMSKLEAQFSELKFDLLVHSVANSLSVEVPAEIMSNPRYRVSSVSYDGYTPALETQVSETLSRGNIFICPYRELQSTIDCPMLIQEAAAAGLCVVTRDYPVSREILGERGVFVGDVKDDDELIMSFTSATAALIGDLSSKHYDDTLARSHELQNLFEATKISREFIEAAFGNR